MGAAGSSAEDEREPLLAPPHADPAGPPAHSRVYGRRWLVLSLFSLLAFMQGMVWNFWGPIQSSAARAFGFTGSDIALLALWGPAGFGPWLLFMWLMDKKGAFVYLVHCVLRCAVTVAGRVRGKNTRSIQPCVYILYKYVLAVRCPTTLV